MDAPGSFTIEKKGKKRVSAKTTGKDKARLSCLMSATASGVKLPVLCVVPKKKKNRWNIISLRDCCDL